MNSRRRNGRTAGDGSRRRARSIGSFSYALALTLLLFLYGCCGVKHVMALSASSSSSSSSSAAAAAGGTPSSASSTASSWARSTQTAQHSTLSNVVVVSTKSNGGHTRRFPLKPSVLTPSQSETTAQAPNTVSTSMQNEHQLSLEQDGRSRRQSWWRQPRRLDDLSLRIVSILRSTFLPIGYPHSVPNGYLSFCRWSWIQDWSTSLRAVVASQRVLEGIGVGRTTATALSAVQAFLVRDAAGMMATLGFTAAASSTFRVHTKQWRLVADMLVDIGITLEVAAVQMPRYLFLPMLCVGNMCKAMCGVAAGATGGSIAVYWASGSSGNNEKTKRSEQSAKSSTEQASSSLTSKTSTQTDISDIHAKFGAQHTVTASLGLLFAALFARSVATAPLTMVWLLYSALTVLHIYANVQCMKAIAFSHLNTARYNLVLQSFFSQWMYPVAAMSENETADSRLPPTTASKILTATATVMRDMILPTPLQISKQEPLFFWNRRPQRQLSPSRIPIDMGISFNEFIERTGKDASTLLQSLDTKRDVDPSTSSRQPYWIAIDANDAKRQRGKANSILVAIASTTSADSTAIDSTNASTLWPRAYFHAALLQRKMEEILHQPLSTINGNRKPRRQGQRALTVEEIQQAEAAAHEVLPEAWATFSKACQSAGWDLTQTTLENHGYEVSTVVEQ